jgi:hypothetical protein
MDFCYWPVAANEKCEFSRLHAGDQKILFFLAGCILGEGPGWGARLFLLRLMRAQL